MQKLFEKIISPYSLIAINVAIILAVELIGGGAYFAETGLVHAIAFIFVALILVRIFSEYAFGDRILRGFLKIQLGFFLFLGLVHVYEYLGLHVFMLEDDVIELTATASYFIWVVGVLFALEFVLRQYHKRSAVLLWILSLIVALASIFIIIINISHEAIHGIPLLVSFLILIAILVLAIASILAVLKVRLIMPVFREYSYYAIPATVLLVLTALAEYFEATHTLSKFGISEDQNLYIAQFFIYAAISFLLVAFGKLKKPQGIYAEM